MDLNLTSILIGGKNSDRNILTHIGPCDEREKTDMFYKVKQRGSRRNQPEDDLGEDEPAGRPVLRPGFSPALRELTGGQARSRAAPGHAGHSERLPSSAAATGRSLGKLMRLCSGTKPKSASRVHAGAG